MFKTTWKQPKPFTDEHRTCTQTFYTHFIRSFTKNRAIKSSGRARYVIYLFHVLLIYVYSHVDEANVLALS